MLNKELLIIKPKLIGFDEIHCFLNPLRDNTNNDNVCREIFGRWKHIYCCPRYNVSCRMCIRGINGYNVVLSRRPER